jgi:lipopolysaccharide export system permease protein
MHFDENGFLKSFTHAKNADFIGNDVWELSDVTTKTFTGNQIESVSTIP